MRRLFQPWIWGISFLVVGLAVSACASKSTGKSGLDSLSKSASIQYQFGWEFFQAGDMIRALAAVSKGIELEPKSADLHNLLGLIHFRQKEYPKAEEAFRKANALDPQLPEVYNNLGAMYYEQGRHLEARDVLLKGLEFPLYLYPDRIQNNLGLVYEALKDLEKAEQAYLAAIRIRENYYLPYQNLGRLLLARGQVPRARAMLLEAVRLCDDCSEARYHLGTALLKENKRSEALSHFKVGAQSDPRGYFGQLCQQFLVGEPSKAR